MRTRHDRLCLQQVLKYCRRERSFARAVFANSRCVETCLNSTAIIPCIMYCLSPKPAACHYNMSSRILMVYLLRRVFCHRLRVLPMPHRYPSTREQPGSRCSTGSRFNEQPPASIWETTSRVFLDANVSPTDVVCVRDKQTDATLSSHRPTQLSPTTVQCKSAGHAEPRLRGCVQEDHDRVFDHCANSRHG